MKHHNSHFSISSERLLQTQAHQWDSFCPDHMHFHPGLHPGGGEEVQRWSPERRHHPGHLSGDRRTHPDHGAGAGPAGPLHGAGEAMPLRSLLQSDALAEVPGGEGGQGEAEGHDPCCWWELPLKGLVFLQVGFTFIGLWFKAESLKINFFIINWLFDWFYSLIYKTFVNLFNLILKKTCLW